MFMLTVFLVVLQLCVRMNVDACIAMTPSNTLSCADLNPAGCCPFGTNIAATDWRGNTHPSIDSGVPTGIDVYPSGTTIGTVTCGSKLTCLYSLSNPNGFRDSNVSPTFTCECEPTDPTSCAVSSSGASDKKGGKGAGTNDCTDCTSVTCVPKTATSC